MFRWPIRLKLMVGLSLVVGMMLIVMGGSTFGLHSFHMSNLTLADQLREIGASGELLRSVCRLHEPHERMTAAELRELGQRVVEAREALRVYFAQFKKNAIQGNRADNGVDELKLALLMDLDLTAILSELDPAHGREDFLFPGTKVHVLPQDQAPVDLKARIERLYDNVSDLPRKLYLDCWTVLH